MSANPPHTRSPGKDSPLPLYSSLSVSSTSQRERALNHLRPAALMQPSRGGAVAEPVGSSTVRKTLAGTYQPLNLAPVLSKEAFQYRKVYLKVSSNISGEAKLTVAGRSEHVRKVPKAREKGSRLKTNGITEKGRKQIQKSVRAHWGLVNNKSCWKGKAFLTELTLTYPKDWPDSVEVARHLKIFFDRFRRYIQNQYGHNDDVHYVWVMEPQKRGAPHFHVETPHFVDKNWLSNAWNDIVNEWQKASGIPVSPVYPSVNKIRNVGSMKEYLTKTSGRIGRTSASISKGTANKSGGGIGKYLTKGSSKTRKEKNELEGRLWGMSSCTRALLKDKEVYFEANNTEEINEIIWQVGERLKARKVFCKVIRIEGTPYKMIWCVNYQVLFQVLNELSETKYKVFEPSELLLKNTG